ncbi:MAG TPA: DNA translocase FtsK [Bacilli bacterium]|nr:DNA translocase FtsK [Bacilli bacterium]
MSDYKKKRPFYIASIETEGIEKKEEQIIQPKPKPIEEKKQPKESVFVSPVLGRVKNDVVVPHAAKYGNKGLQYESFRDKKTMTKEELKKKYGTEYYEFGVFDSVQYKELLRTGKVTPRTLPKEDVRKEPVVDITPISFEEQQKMFEEAEHEFFNQSYKEKFVQTQQVTEEEFYDEDEEIPYYEEEVQMVQPVEVKQPAKTVEPKPITTQSHLNKKYQYPPLAFLRRGEKKIEEDSEWIKTASGIIDSTLEEFEIRGKVVNAIKGPAVTQYEIKLEPGVNVKVIGKIADTFQMNLSATNIRIQMPIPGKPFVGIEVPNKNPEVVALGDLIHNEKYYRDGNPLNVALGIDINGDYIYSDIDKMPHGLIAGTTGSGKSVCINSMIISMLYKSHPDQLKLLLIDPKMVELAAYEEIPHLAAPVINDPKTAAASLRWAVEEMEKRFQLFKINRTRDIAMYNQMALSTKQKIMPYIVIIIDELADLMSVAGNEVEGYIQRITQKARAAGIHLIVATQRPSTDIIRGSIKNNIPVRAAFKVASYVDSMTILDHGGAEKLLGKGDMLYSDGMSERRLQGAYVSDYEITNITNFLRDNNGLHYLFQPSELDQATDELSNGEDYDDELFDTVAHYVVENANASINNLQKYFGMGFNRAQAIITELEKRGIVSESVKGKPREVLVDIEELKAKL